MKQLISETQTVTEYKPVGRYRVRVINGKDGGRLVDVREFVKGESFEGYTRRGIRLTREETEQLIDELKQCVANIKSAAHE
jgi:hypothetical protein